MNKQSIAAAATILMFALVTAVASCTSSGTATDTTLVSEGTVSIAVTDAASDELESLEVEIAAIRLYRLSGVVTSVLAQPVVVDFAALSELSEILDVVNLPVALYTRAEMDMNFSNARARIIGQTTDAAITDSAGAALTGTQTINVTFGSMSLPAGRHRVLEFDFDLDSAVTVDAGNNTIAVSPTIITRIDRTDARSLALIGELVSADVVANSFVMTLKRPNGLAIRDVTCTTDTSTVFQVDGQASTGAAGIAAVAALAAGTRIQCYGAADTTSRTFGAEYVEAGVGALGSGTDTVGGFVTARTGVAGADPVLTVRGFSVNAQGRPTNFNTDFTVNLSFANTNVVRRMSGTAYDTDDINIGQAIRVYGTLAGTTLTATSATSMARMYPTPVLGFALGAASGSTLTINVQRIWLRDVAAFNFDINATPQADPANFAVNIGSLSSATIGVNSPVRVRGFFPAVDAVGDDFDADALEDFDALPSGIRIRYLPASSAPFTASSSTSVTFDISNASLAVVDRSFVGTQNLAAAPVVVPNATALIKIFTIVENAQVATFSDFGAFIGEIELRLATGSNLLHFNAVGNFDDITNTMTTALASALLN